MFKPKNQIHDMDAWVEERLSDYMDETLAPKERAMVEAHLQTSERARASLESLRWTVSLIKQTPAPALPRQFTLPVTPRAPARSAPGWMVWTLRGIAVAGTAAFVLLLAGTLLRQPPAGNTAMVQQAAPAEPSVMVALAPTNAPPQQPPAPAQDNTSDTNSASTPVMITVPAPGAADNQPQQLPEPTLVARAQPQATQAPAQSKQAAPPTPTQRAAKAQPTEAPVALELQPTTSAAGASNAAGAAPELATEPANATGAAAAQSAFDAQGIDGMIVAERLKVRAGPGTQYRTIATLKRDDHVRIIGHGETRDWLAVQFEQDGLPIEGWVAARFVQPGRPVDYLPIIAPPANETPESAPETPGATETPTPTLPSSYNGPPPSPETPEEPISTPEGSAGVRPIV